MTACELCERDVINVITGERLGKVDDISFDENTACITGVILYGRLRLFGLLGREEDLVIPWNRIEKIGADVLLVHAEENTKRIKQKKRFCLDELCKGGLF